MVDRLVFRTDTRPAEEHPAVAAWRELEPSASMPHHVDVLRNHMGQSPGRKSAVYRLSYTGRGGAPVIAKLSKRSSVHIEAFVYQEILPSLPMPSVYCYGVLDEDEDRAWIFLDEVRGPRFDEERLDHRRLAAEWLGAIHAATAELDRVKQLPALGLDRYLVYLRRGREKIERNAGNSALGREDIDVLTTLVERLDALEARWSEVESLCAVAPRCLVHGDFIAKNVKVRSEDDAGVLYAMDWESAGWGVAVEDLGGLDQTIADFGGTDIEAYRQAVRPVWSTLDRPGAERLIYVGIILRYLAWIQATSSGLRADWVDGTVASLRSYAHRLDEALNFVELA